MLRFMLKSSLFIFPFLIIGIGMIISGFYTDMTSLTSDGFNLKYFKFIFGGAFVVFPIVLFAIISLFALVKQSRANELLETGKQGTAKVIRLEDTGTRINNNPRVNILLEMDFEGYQTYQVWKKLTIPIIRLSQVQVGETIAVLADPHDPQNAKRIGLMLK